MPKITKVQAYGSENYWLWNQSYEDPTADLDWTGEELEQNDTKQQNETSH